MIDLLKTMTVMENGNIIFLDNIVMGDDDDQWISTLTQLWYHSHIAVVRKSMEFTIRLLKYYSTIKQLVSYKLIHDYHYYRHSFSSISFNVYRT